MISLESTLTDRTIHIKDGLIEAPLSSPDAPLSSPEGDTTAPADETIVAPSGAEGGTV